MMETSITLTTLTTLGSWDLACFAFCDDLVVLGPKCRSSGCMAPAARRVWWVTGPFLACERCAESWSRVARLGLDMTVLVEEVFYQRGDRDEAEQRFAAMELK